MDTTRVYAAITKSDRQPDGTLLVRGTATTPSLDVDEQVCDPQWLSTAMPRWFKWGNIREQHSHIAAGVATEYQEKDGGVHDIAVRVVDSGSVRKVEQGVLKGFSIGIRNPRITTDKAAPGGRIVGGEILEISLVDRPANGDCTLTLAKTARPGMEVHATDYDPETNLVHVEELAVKDAAPPPDRADTAAAGHPAPDAGEAAAAAAASGAPAPVPPLDGDAPAEGEPGDADTATGEKPPEQAEDAPSAPDSTAPTGPVGDDGEGPEKAAQPPTVDRAAVEGIVRDILKREFTPKDREAATASGAAMPQGGFPIKTIKDLRNAITSVGRAKDPAAAKAHIVARAKALGREDLIPSGWQGGDSGKVAGTDEMAHDPVILQQVRDGLLNLIIAEAQEALHGEREEYDISMLLDALGRFLCWWDNEAWEGEAPAPADLKTPDADTGKAAESGPLPVEPVEDPPPTIPAPAAPAPEADSTTAVPDEGTAPPDADTVKAAVAQATAALQTRLDTALARLEQVEKAAAPGGPVRVRPTAADTSSREADALRMQIARLKATEKGISMPDLSKAYRDQIGDLEGKLRAITTPAA